MHGLLKMRWVHTVMSDKAKSFLICYDICDKRRLQRVHKAIRDVGVPIQYSVFLADIKPSELKVLLEDLRQLIDVSEDKVNFYHLTASKQKICLGVPPLSADTLFF